MIITALRRAGSLLGDGRRRVLPALLLFAILLVGPVGIVQAQDLPERASVSGLAGYPQRFSLSCESRSAVDWAGFWGVSIREKRFLNELPRSDNPDAGFVGDPDGEWGNLPPRSYGVHAEPVAALYEQGKVRHVGAFPALEDEMCDFGRGGRYTLGLERRELDSDGLIELLLRWCERFPIASIEDPAVIERILRHVLCGVVGYPESAPSGRVSASGVGIWRSG